MLKKYNPDTVYEPVAAYYQSVEVPAGARWLITAGQVGITPDGTLVKDPEAQIEQVWNNVAALLAAADMAPEDLVKLTIYLIDVEHFVTNRKYREAALVPARDEALPQPDSTALVRAGSAHKLLDGTLDSLYV